MGVGRNGLGHALLMPANVSIVLPSSSLVSVSCDTNYPFTDTLQYTITSTNAFDFHIRVPEWAMAFEVSVGGLPYECTIKDIHSGMVSIRLPAGNSSIVYDISSDVRVEPRANSTVSIHHGPLLYALDVGHSIEVLHPHNYGSHRPFPSTNLPSQAHDYIMNNTRPWNIAVDPSTFVYHSAASASSEPFRSSVPLKSVWAHGAPAGYVSGRGCEIAWPQDHGVPAPVPLEESRTCIGKSKDVIFRPYGSLKVHMAELPTIKLNARDEN